MTALPKGEPRVCAPLYRRIPRRREAVRPTTVYRTCAVSLLCHSEPVLTLAWESVPRARRRGIPLASLCEGGSAKRRRERRCTTAPSLLVRRGRCPHRPAAPAGAEHPSSPSVREGSALRADGGIVIDGRGRAPPLHTVFRWPFRRGRCPHRPAVFASYSGRAEPSALHSVYRASALFFLCHSEGAKRPWESVSFSCHQRPKAATYLCRFAAKARFDNRPNPRRVFPKGEARTDRKPSIITHHSAQEVLKPVVSSRPFGHFWGCGQK